MARETKIAETDMYGIGFKNPDGTVDHSRPRKRGHDNLLVRKGEEYTYGQMMLLGNKLSDQNLITMNL